MSDLVTCAQCGTQYGAGPGAFCPRCGSTAKGAVLPAAVAVARRHDPSRRRVQASGAVLLSVGALLTLAFAAMLVLSADLTSGFLDAVEAEDQALAVPGGKVVVLVQDNGTAQQGAAVNVTTLAGVPVANGTTDAAGRFEAELGDQAFVNVTVARAGGDVVRRVVAIEGSSTTVRVELATAPATTGWIGLGTLLLVLRVMLGAFLAVAAVLAAAGVCALRLRAWGFAVTGAVLGVIPVLLLTVASLSVGFLLMLGAIGVPLVLIARGRRHFEAAPERKA